MFLTFETYAAGVEMMGNIHILLLFSFFAFGVHVWTSGRGLEF